MEHYSKLMVKPNLKDIGRSINQRLSNLSIKHKTPFQELLTDFLIERMLARIVKNKKLRDMLVFKGGYVSVKIYNSDRYTKDLDTILEQGNMKQIVNIIKEAVSSDIGDGVWFIFDNEIDLETQNEYGGIRLNFRAGTGKVITDIKKAKIINIDIGYGDPITPSPIKSTIKTILDDSELSWRIYPVETTVAEKLHALVSRQSFNSISKDIYDLFLLLPKCDKEILAQAIKATFKYSSENIPKSFSQLLLNIDTKILEAGWKKATESLQNKKSFKEVFKTVINYCENIL